MPRTGDWGLGTGDWGLGSMPYWIDLGETLVPPVRQFPPAFFQYPLSDRSWWDFRQYLAPDRFVVFQYPLSDRSWWDSGATITVISAVAVSVSSIGSILVGRTTPAHPATRQGSFSILYRIDLGGTVFGPVRAGDYSDRFSILYRIDLGGT